MHPDTLGTYIELKLSLDLVHNFLPIHKSTRGANPKIVSYNHKNFYGYNASVVKICNTMSSLDRFESKNIFFNLKKTLYYYNNAGTVAVGMAPRVIKVE
jgi:hypothetical protein